MTILATWLESYLISGFYRKPSGQKWIFEDFDDGELFKTSLSRCEKKGSKRSLNLFLEQKLVLKVRATCRNAPENSVAATHTAFRERPEFFGQLSKSGGNSDFIDYLNK